MNPKIEELLNKIQERTEEIHRLRVENYADRMKISNIEKAERGKL